MYGSAMQPHDTDRVRSYGEVGEIPAAMFNEFMTMFASENAPNPQEVARAISALVETPKGQRSARTVVGSSFGADQINEFVAPVQSSVVDGLGLSELRELKAAEKTAELV